MSKKRLKKRIAYLEAMLRDEGSPWKDLGFAKAEFVRGPVRVLYKPADHAPPVDRQLCVKSGIACAAGVCEFPARCGL